MVEIKEKIMRPQEIAHVHDLAAICASRHPQLAARAERAAEIVANNEVHYTKGETYEIHGWITTHKTCNCPDFATRAPATKSGQRYCKHILAVLLTCKLTQEEMNEQKPAEYRPNIWQQTQQIAIRISAAKAGYGFV